MASMHLINRNEFQPLIAAKKAAVVHFDAPWNTYRAGVRQAMEQARQMLGDRVAFAEVDIDVEIELAKSFDICNVPFLAYFRNGAYVGGRIGAFPDIKSQLERILRGESIV